MPSLNSVCPRCGTQFDCDIAAGKEHCWCFLLPSVLPAVSGKECFCPECLRRIAEEQKQGKREEK